MIRVTPVFVRSTMSLHTVLSTCCGVVMLVGPRPGGGTWEGWLRWKAEPLPHGWEPSPRGHYLAPDVPVLRFVRADGVTCEVRRWHGWVDESEHTAPAAAVAAWGLVEATLPRMSQAWSRAGTCLLASPAATGRHLLSLSMPYGRSLERCSTATAELLRATTTQGRVELVPDLPAGGELYVYDARLAYLGVTRHLGCGEPVHLSGEPVDPYAHLWCRFRATAPAGWCHLGLLPHLSVDGWVWPTAGSFAGWATGAEIMQARKHGWEVTVTEHLVWGDEDLLRSWSDHLIAAEANIPAADDPHVTRQAARMVRSIALHAIGAFHGRPRKVTRQAPFEAAADLPDSATAVHMDGDDLVWTETETGGWGEQFQHPEWTTQIWGRTRARLADSPGTGGDRTGFLFVSPGYLYGVRTDSIWCTRPLWGTGDYTQSKVGRYRLTRTATNNTGLRPSGWKDLDRWTTI